MKITGPDAAATAIKYGQISSAVFPAMGYICSKAKVISFWSIVATVVLLLIFTQINFWNFNKAKIVL